MRTQARLQVDLSMYTQPMRSWSWSGRREHTPRAEWRFRRCVWRRAHTLAQCQDKPHRPGRQVNA